MSEQVDDTLPELPKPAGFVCDMGGEDSWSVKDDSGELSAGCDVFTADQMRAYALRARHSDKDLLERAAKAAGYPLGVSGDGFFIAGAEPMQPWNPLEDDRDAALLMVGLSIGLDHTKGFVTAYPFGGLSQFLEPVGADRGAATRRAIVRAAASGWSKS